METFTLKSTRPDQPPVNVTERFWGTLRWRARRCGWKPKGTKDTMLGAYDVSGARIVDADAQALARALTRIDVMTLTDEEQQVALRVKWLAHAGEFSVYDADAFVVVSRAAKTEPG